MASIAMVVQAERPSGKVYWLLLLTEVHDTTGSLTTGASGFAAPPHSKKSFNADNVNGQASYK